MIKTKLKAVILFFIQILFQSKSYWDNKMEKRLCSILSIFTNNFMNAEQLVSVFSIISKKTIYFFA